MVRPFNNAKFSHFPYSSQVSLETPVTPQIPFANGKALSSSIPPVHLITEAHLRKLAERCAAGVASKGDKAWNALSNNQEILTDFDFIYERIGHVILHACHLRDKLRMLQMQSDGVMDHLLNDDDAGAIAWGAMFLCSAVDALTSKVCRSDSVRPESIPPDPSTTVADGDGMTH